MRCWRAQAPVSELFQQAASEQNRASKESKRKGAICHLLHCPLTLHCNGGRLWRTGLLAVPPKGTDDVQA
ncbi:hypothetical protein QO004_004298 [Rhizobium mesoamericanum]|nr:hypothetical protein [Rhizobium mesoamericanum]